MSREIHIHVEEPSMEAFLRDFLPRVLPNTALWRPINHGSKPQLLKELPKRLRGYASTPLAFRPLALVLIDRDEDDCKALKAQLEAAAQDAGLIHKSQADGVEFDVVNRIVVEELEAWYFGDAIATAAAWPGVKPTFASSARYRNPDAIKGGTHEAFLRVLHGAGHWKDQTRLPKVESARRMAAHIDPARNSSRSFQHFLSGLNALVELA
ncbi:DUF4276 family protein [Sphingomonas sp. RS6]